MQRFFKEMISGVSEIENSLFPKHSNIRKVKLSKSKVLRSEAETDESPEMFVFFGPKEASYYIELRDHTIFHFYKKCERESKKINVKEVEEKKSGSIKSEADPNYCLSEEVLRKIKNYHTVEKLAIPSCLKIDQEQMNALYEHYYLSVMKLIKESKGKPVIIVSGQEHDDDASFLQDLMIY